MRLFFAIDLPDEIKGRLAHVQDQWDNNHEYKINWAKRENLHVTLKFLGEVDDTSLMRLLEAMRSFNSSGRIQLRTESMEYFPKRGPIRIIAVEVGHDVARLGKIYDQLEEICESQGFKREGRQYRPHITIGRSRDGLPGNLRFGHRDKPWPERSPLFTASEFVLMESHLGPAGPKYVKLAGFSI